MVKISLATIYLATTLLLCIGERTTATKYQYGCPYAQQRTFYVTDVLPEASAPSAAAVASASILDTIQPAPKYDEIVLPPNGGASLFGNNLFKNYFAGDKSHAPDECAVPPISCTNDTNNYYYRTLDGSCNNLVFPGFGIASARYVRLMSPKYSDSLSAPTFSINGAPLPSSRLISLTLYGDETHPDSFRTLALLHWGQFVAHDISRFKTDGSKDCCTNVNSNRKSCYPIALHPYGPIASVSGKRCLNFVRAIDDIDAQCPKSGLPYAEKISFATAYLDLSPIYGNSLQESRKLRQYRNGLLAYSWSSNRIWPPVSQNENGECGENKKECYNIPDRRNEILPGTMVLHTLLLREHNRLANALAQLNPQYSDERLYQEARKINIAQFQKITYYDWLPLVLGQSYAYANNLVFDVQRYEYVQDYNARVNAAPYVEYAAAALRYCHNQVPGWFSLVAPDQFSNYTLRLSNYFGRPGNLLTVGDNFDALLRGLATQVQKRADANIDKEIKHYFNRKDFEQFGADLKSIDIQRGRDYGLPSYNDLREFCGLPRAYDWAGFLNEISEDKIKLMRQLYASPDDVDLSVGGSLEAHAAGALLGPTFQCIVGRQFLKTRIGDRFFFEHDNRQSGFTREQLAELRKVSLASLFCNNGDYLQYTQANVFISPNQRNILRSCHSIQRLDLSKWKETQRSIAYHF